MIIDEFSRDILIAFFQFVFTGYVLGCKIILSHIFERLNIDFSVPTFLLLEMLLLISIQVWQKLYLFRLQQF
jgi:hypothetical protein